MRRKLGILGLAVAAATGPAGAAPVQDTVLGRQVPARADAPAGAATTQSRTTFVLHCGGCHRADGSGVPAAYVPDLRRVGAFLQVEGGRDFVVKVPGVMGSGLDDRQVAELMNWLLATLARDGVPPDHRPFDAAEVARARARPLLDVAAERQRLVQRAQARGLALD